MEIEIITHIHFGGRVAELRVVTTEEELEGPELVKEWCEGVLKRFRETLKVT